MEHKEGKEGRTKNNYLVFLSQRSVCSEWLIILDPTSRLTSSLHLRPLGVLSERTRHAVYIHTLFGTLFSGFVAPKYPGDPGGSVVDPLEWVTLYPIWNVKTLWDEYVYFSVRGPTVTIFFRTSRRGSRKCLLLWPQLLNRIYSDNLRLRSSLRFRSRKVVSKITKETPYFTTWDSRVGFGRRMYRVKGTPGDSSCETVEVQREERR